MCGIAGYYHYGLNAYDTYPDINQMLHKLAHRGPDDSGMMQWSRIALGHTRLSIIDLTKAGHQPMSSGLERYWITFNGEIYNYIELRKELQSMGCNFYSGTDTEVILHAYAVWGEACVEKFNGMWAFVILDTLKESFFCSRDRFGIKPFYYYNALGLFVFASEPKAITAALPCTKAVDYPQLYHFSTTGKIFDNDHTFFEKIKCLPAAHNMSVSKSGISLCRYWDYPKREQGESIDVKDINDKFLELFTDSVALRSRSDVEIGTTLSGGLDSTAILATYRRLFKTVSHRTYSAVFKERNCDESEYINSAVQAYKTKSNLIIPSRHEFECCLPKIVYALDSPVLSPATFPLWKIMEKVNKDSIKVLFDGQGADELLAGYDYQFIPPLIHSFMVSLFKGRNDIDFRKDIAPWLTADRMKWLIRYFVPAAHVIYKKMVKIESVFSDNFRALAVTKDKFKHINPYYHDPLSNALYLTHSQTILPGLLHYGDAISMAHSVEYRVPFLDYRLVEFGFKLFNHYKLRGGYTKIILRDSMGGILLDKVRLRKSKYGFNTPVPKWLTEKNNSFVHDILLSRSCRERGIYDTKKIAKLINESNTKADISSYIFRWLTTELWFQQCVDD